MVVHVCGDGCGDGYENGSENLAESQADGDVALTARWKHQREKDVGQGNRCFLARLFFSHRVCTGYR